MKIWQKTPMIESCRTRALPAATTRRVEMRLSGANEARTATAKRRSTRRKGELKCETKQDEVDKKGIESVSGERDDAQRKKGQKTSKRREQ
jgi:hypothetical protein